MARRRREFGAVRKLPSGRYQARYWDETTGEHLPAPTTFTTRAAAASWLSAVHVGVVDVERLVDGATPPTFEEFARDWLDTRPLRPRTRQLYEHQLRKHILPTFGPIPVDEVTAPLVRRWYADQRRRGLSQTTVAKHYRLARSIFQTAVDDEVIAKNPCMIKGGGVEDSAEREIPDIATVAAIADALPEHLAVVPWIAALGGLRKGEILGLAREHIDLARGAIRVERALTEITGEGARFAEPKTSAGVRVVSAPPTLLGLLAGHLDAHVDPRPDALMFTNSKGAPVRASVWSPAWDAARVEAGAPAVRLHDLRHLAGTLTAQAGATLREAMDRLGHTSPQAALRYQHVAASRPGEIANAIERLVNPASADEPKTAAPVEPADARSTGEQLGLDLGPIDS